MLSSKVFDLFYMLLRKIGASLLVMLFVLLSLPNFLIYGLSRTYLNTDFYRREDLNKGVYNYVLDQTVTVLRNESEMFKGYFDREELRVQIEKVFTVQIFSETLADFANQLDVYKKNTDKPLVISLKTFRENLLTVGNNLAYLIYQNLPTCSDAELLSLIAAKNTAPECVPKNLPYDQVIQPINDNFENTIYNQIPEELSNIDQAIPIKALVGIENYKNFSFILLVIVLALIGLIIYGKTSTIVAYISSAFLLGGGLGYAFSYVLINLPSIANMQFSEEATLDFFQFILNFLTVEIQRLSMMFVGVGAMLLLIRFVLKRTVENKPNTI
jgi:hypothetical protein